MGKLIHKILYKLLPLALYLRVVSGLFFLCRRLGFGRRSAALEYVYHLPQLVKAGDTVIDIGANLGYYSRPLAGLVGEQGRVYAVEPMIPVLAVLRRNLRRCSNVEILPYALGAGERTVSMGNDSASRTGYFGTGQNFVNEAGVASDVEFTAPMRRGSELFGDLPRVDFIKCDIEGYEVVVMNEIKPLLEHFHPTVLIETGGENRPQIIALFAELGYTGFTLDAGREVPLMPESEKDIIFRYAN